MNYLNINLELLPLNTTIIGPDIYFENGSKLDDCTAKLLSVKEFKVKNNADEYLTLYFFEYEKLSYPIVYDKIWTQYDHIKMSEYAAKYITMVFHLRVTEEKLRIDKEISKRRNPSKTTFVQKQNFIDEGPYMKVIYGTNK